MTGKIWFDERKEFAAVGMELSQVAEVALASYSGRTLLRISASKLPRSRRWTDRQFRRPAHSALTMTDEMKERLKVE